MRDVSLVFRRPGYAHTRAMHYARRYVEERKMDRIVKEHVAANTVDAMTVKLWTGKIVRRWIDKCLLGMSRPKPFKRFIISN